jgi:hypothetical protein
LTPDYLALSRYAECSNGLTLDSDRPRSAKTVFPQILKTSKSRLH